MQNRRVSRLKRLKPSNAKANIISSTEFEKEVSHLNNEVFLNSV